MSNISLHQQHQNINFKYQLYGSCNQKVCLDSDRLITNNTPAADLFAGRGLLLAGLAVLFSRQLLNGSQDFFVLLF